LKKARLTVEFSEVRLIPDMPPGCVIGGVPCGAIGAGKPEKLLRAAHADAIRHHLAKVPHPLLREP